MQPEGPLPRPQEPAYAHTGAYMRYVTYPIIFVWWTIFETELRDKVLFKNREVAMADGREQL